VGWCRRRHLSAGSVPGAGGDHLPGLRAVRAQRRGEHRRGSTG
jgi:hypothetical protein